MGVKLHPTTPSAGQLEFLSGIFWGEGCVSIGKSHYKPLFVQVGNSDKDMVDLFDAFWPGARGAWVPYTGVQMYNWRIQGERACDFCDALLATDIGGKKREQLEIGRRYRPLLGRKGESVTAEVLAGRNALYAEMKRLTDPYGTRTGGRRAEIAV